MIFELVFIINRLYRNMAMKNNFLEKDYGNRPVIQTSLHMQYSHPSPLNNSKDFSVDRNIRRISPAPHERFSQIPTPAVLPLKRYASNDYQLTPKISQFYPVSDSKFIQDLLKRIQKLEGRNDKIDNLESRVQKIQINHFKVEPKMEKATSGRDKLPKGKENSMNIQNRQEEYQPLKLSRQEEPLRLRGKSEFVTKQDLKREMLGLNDAFKNVFDLFKTSISTEMGEYNTKSKKKFIQITATQLSEKLEQFKSNFLKEWNQQIDSVVKQAWRNQFVGKTAIGISKQKFLGTAIPIKMKEQLTISTQNGQKEIVSNEIYYYIDRNGFLLDSNKYYLLDVNSKEIKLHEDHLEQLKKEGLMVAPLSPDRDLTLSKSQSMR